MNSNTLVLALLLVFQYSFGQNDFTISEYMVEIEVLEIGELKVSEQINVNFKKESRGIIRKIPLVGKLKGHKQEMHLDDIRVNHPFSTTKRSNNFEIKIGDKNTYLRGAQEYEITYTASNAILNFDDHFEIYWTLIGGEWEVDILSANFIVKIPEEIKLRPEDYYILSGETSSKTDYATIEYLGTQLKGESLVTLGKGKGLTLGVRFPKDAFNLSSKAFDSNRENSLDKTQFSTLREYGFFFPLGLIFALVGSYLKYGRNKGEYINDKIYYPPHDFKPAEVGTYIDSTVNNRDLISLIPYWANQSILMIKSNRNGRLNSEIYLEKIGELPDESSDYEHYFFNELFSFGNVVFIDDLKHVFYKEFAKAKTKLKQEVLTEDFYDTDSLKRFHSNTMWLYVILALALGISSIIFLKSVSLGMCFFALCIVLIVVRFLPAKRSLNGQNIYLKLEAFRDTIKNPDPAELMRINDKDPGYFEKIFPYAVALGLDKKWLISFKDIALTAPTWFYYLDGSPAAYSDFSRDFNMKVFHKNLSASPRADSSSSSFGGSGGSVGGGFGGGGGSSW